MLSRCEGGRLDQRRENIELIARWRTSGRTPNLLDLGECFCGGLCRRGSGGFARWSLPKSRDGQSVNSIVFSRGGTAISSIEVQLAVSR